MQTPCGLFFIMYIKYYPYQIGQTRNFGAYYSFKKLFSFGCKIMLAVGARRIGKTFGAKCIAIDHYLKNIEKNKFVWIRDSETAIDELCAANGRKFFSDVFANVKKFKGFSGRIDGGEFFVNDLPAGYVVPASTFYKFKGTDYSDCNLIIMDEFIPENGQRVPANRVYSILNTLYTIASTRPDIRVIMLANALDKNDELLHAFGINITGFGYYVNRELNIALHYSDETPEFIEMQKNGVISKIIAKTEFADNVLHAKFMDDETMFFKKRPADCVLLAAIHTESGSARIYGDNNNLYVSRDFNYNKILNYRYVRKFEMITYGRQMIPAVMLDAFRRQHAAGITRFENGHVRNVFLDFIK